MPPEPRRTQLRVSLRLEDHKHDEIGSIFLGVIEGEKALEACLSRYFGPQISVRNVERGDAYVRANIACVRFEEESHNLLQTGRGMLAHGRVRAARRFFQEALQLDPLNAIAMKAEAATRQADGDLAGARTEWVRGGEIGGFDGATLRGLASVALAEGRSPTAKRYLEEALDVDSSDEEARTLLEDLNRQVEIRFDE